MTDRSQYFSRVSDRVDLRVLSEAFVALVGVGSVGSTMALELARCGVGHLLLVDGDRLQVANLARHALPSAYVGNNKAEAAAHHLMVNIPRFDVGAVPHHLDDTFTDEQIDRLLKPAQLVIVATDKRAAQRRIAARALAMDIPAVVPGLYADRGGEVFVQLNPGQACFRCWDDFRDPDAEVRGVSSINADALSVIQHATYLSIAVLDPRSRHARDLAPPPADPRPRQLFVLRPGAALLRTPVTRRPGCPGCAVGPSPIGEEPRPATPAAGAAVPLTKEHPRAPAAGWRFTLAPEPVVPEIEQVSVSEPVIAEGTHVTLSWLAHNATHVLVEGHGTHPPEGELTVLVNANTAFRVRAVNPFGEVTAISPTVRTVRLPRIQELRLAAFPQPQLMGGPSCQAFTGKPVHATHACSRQLGSWSALFPEPPRIHPSLVSAAESARAPQRPRPRRR